MSSLFFSASFAVNAQIWEKERQSVLLNDNNNDGSTSHSICQSIKYEHTVMACARQYDPPTPGINLTYEMVLYEFDKFGIETQRVSLANPIAGNERHLIPTKVVKKTHGNAGYYVLAYTANNNPISPSSTNNWTGNTTPVIFEFNQLFQMVASTEITSMDGILLDMEISPLGYILLSGYEDVSPFKLLSNDRYGIVMKMTPTFTIVWTQSRSLGGTNPGYHERFDVIESVHCFMYAGQERYFLSGATTKQELIPSSPPYPYIYYVPYSLAILIDDAGNLLWETNAKRNGMGADAIYDPVKNEIIHLINGYDIGISPVASLVTYNALSGMIGPGFAYEGNPTLTSQNNQKSFHDLYNLEIEKAGTGSGDYRIFGLTPEFFSENLKQSTVFGQMHNLITLSYNNNSRTFSDMLFYPTNTEETYWANPSLIGHLPKESYYDGLVVPSNKMNVSLFFSQENSMVWINNADFEMSGTYKFGNFGLGKNVTAFFQSGTRLLKSDITSIEFCNKNRVVIDATSVSFTNAELYSPLSFRFYTTSSYNPTIKLHLNSSPDCTSALPPFKP